MIFIDAAFIIYLFMYITGQYADCSEYNNMGNEMGFFAQVYRDLFLAENQLPFFVLDNLYNVVLKGANPNMSFRDLTLNFIQRGTNVSGEKGASSMTKRRMGEFEIHHLVDFLRIYYLPSKLRGSVDGKLPDKSEYIKYPLTAKDLKAAGVEFVASESQHLLDITFSKGVLEIPKLIIEDDTETIIRNLVFFEQTQYHNDSYFIDYMMFLDDSIDTLEDVQVLVENDIIEHWLGSNEEVKTAINNMLKNIAVNNENFCYRNVCQELNAHASKNWNRWKVILRREYFNHPWSTISVIYVVILLILTVLQVYTGFKQLK